MNDLSTILANDVTANEPSAALDVMVPVRLGRHRLRTRRMLSSAAVIVVFAVGTAVAAPRLVADSGETPAVDSPAEKLPGLMDDRIRPVLERTVGDLGPARFLALSNGGKILPESKYDRARTVQTTYDAGVHTITVLISQPNGVFATVGTPPCPGLEDDRTRARCEVVSQSPDGYVVERMVPVSVSAGAHGSPMPRALYAHEVVVTRGFRTLVVQEVVPATTDLSPDAFTVPSADLRAIAQDPALDFDLPLRRLSPH
jgi:hypothetical protein